MVSRVSIGFSFFQAEVGIRVLVRARGLGDVYKRRALGELPCATLTIARHPDAPAMLDAVKSLLAGLPAA